MRVRDVLITLGLLRLKKRDPVRSTARPDPGPPTQFRAEPEPKANAKKAAAQAQKNRERHGARGVFNLIKDSAKEWNDDKAPRLGAALSYYTVFALAPVLLVAISVAGLVLGTDAAQGRILDELRAMFGAETAQLIQEMLAKSATKSSGLIGTIVGFGTLLLGATAVMLELEAALDAVWKVKPKEGRGVKGLVKDRILSLGLVLSLGFLLLVSLVASAVLAAVGDLMERVSFPGAATIGLVLSNLVTIGVIALFFALVFKYLPNTRIAWRDVWVGALVTSVLFNLGKIGIGLYLGRATVASTFGAAGSLAVLLVWVYYTAQIVLFGAEVTRLYAERYGSGIRPDEDAVPAPRAAEVMTNAPA